MVDADDSAKIQLVLAGVDINCESSAAIYVKNANKVFITLAEKVKMCFQIHPILLQQMIIILIPLFF